MGPKTKTKKRPQRSVLVALSQEEHDAIATIMPRGMTRTAWCRVAVQEKIEREANGGKR